MRKITRHISKSGRPGASRRWGLLLALWGLGFLRMASAQDVHFSQFFEAPLWRNPSLAGLFAGDVRFQGVFRTQWGAVTVPYQTGSLNGEYKMPVGGANDFLTLGGQIVYDRAGTTRFTTTSLLPAINYHKALSGERNTYLSLGFMGGMVQRSIDRSKITTASQYDGSGYNPFLDINEDVASYQTTYGDASVGMSFNSQIGESAYDNFFIGAAYHHFNRPANSFYRTPSIELNPKWVYSLGLRLGITPHTYLDVEADYSWQGTYTEILGGALVGFALSGYDFSESVYNIHFGAFARWGDAIIPVVKMDFLPFSAAFSYDMNISQLRAASQGRGGFEFSISYRGFSDRDNSSKNAVLCPRF
jgi:type IX secretion system PorP/SprF family membrane protein